MLFRSVSQSRYQICEKGISPGIIHTFKENGDIIFNVPTKDDLSDSTIEIVKKSLTGLYILLIGARPWLAGATIAMPALGCGLGGLDWETEVKHLVLGFCEYELLSDYQFIVFEPKAA